MLIGNIKSAKDLSDKLAVQKQLLELEAANEATTQKRIQESGVKAREIEKIPEQYKTLGERQKDNAVLEKKAIDNFIDLGFNYSDAGQLAKFVSNEGKLAAFNSGYKDIKKTITEKYDTSLINTTFVKTFLTNYFDDLEVNLGKKFGKEAQENREYDIIGVRALYPDYNDIYSLKQDLIDILEIDRVNKGMPLFGLEDTGKVKLLIALFDRFVTILPSEDIFIDIIGLSQNERFKLAKSLDRAFRISKAPTREDILEVGLFIPGFKTDLYNSRFGDRRPDLRRFFLIINRLIRQLSSIGDAKAGNAFENFYNEYKSTINTKGVYTKLDKDLDDKITEIRNEYQRDIISQIEENYRATKRYNDRLSVIAEGQDPQSIIVNQQLANRELEEKLKVEAELEAEQKQLKEGRLEKESEQRAQFLPSIIEKVKQKNKGDTTEYLVSLIDTLDELEDSRKKSAYKELARLMRQKYEIVLDEEEQGRLDTIIQKKNSKIALKDINTIKKLLEDKSDQFGDNEPNYNPSISNTPLSYSYNKNNYQIPDTKGGVFGLGAKPKLLNRLKKHFKGDEKLLRKVVKVLEQEDSSSDSEESRELTRHQKATAKLDKQAEAFVSGVGFKSKRIPVGKVGKGVKLENEIAPTYRQFGKYVIHIPHLLNNNVANFKYPSLGSIPSIKPLTVSEDYKDLILETLQTGKLNKKEFERLPQSEIKHFERVAVGAGLVEQLGLKIGTTDEDKADAKRFEVLRGEYLAGNNNEKLIKELRLLITKFINTGRIHKTEGLNLLLELSTV
jgi:hypothetical protein